MGKSLIPIQFVTEPFIEAVPQVVILLCIRFLSGDGHESGSGPSFLKGKSRIFLHKYVIVT